MRDTGGEKRLRLLFLLLLFLFVVFLMPHPLHTARKSHLLTPACLYSQPRKIARVCFPVTTNKANVQKTTCSVAKQPPSDTTAVLKMNIWTSDPLLSIDVDNICWVVERLPLLACALEIESTVSSQNRLCFTKPSRYWLFRIRIAFSEASNFASGISTRRLANVSRASSMRPLRRINRSRREWHVWRTG